MNEDKIGQIAVNEIRHEFGQQGHNLTGSGSASIQFAVIHKQRSTEIDVTAFRYVRKLDEGIKPSNYVTNIGGLMDYAKKRFGLSDQKDQRRAAFAMRRTHLREGMPSIASQRFSKTGKRTGFVPASMVRIVSQVAPLVLQMAETETVKFLNQQIKQIEGR